MGRHLLGKPEGSFNGWREMQKLSGLPKFLLPATRDAVILSHMAHHDPDLDRIFQALSDPTRRQMLARLGRGAVPVSELARPTGMALPTILRHLGVLEEAGLIATTKSGRTRLCEARPETLAATMDWLAEQRAIWEARTDRLEALLKTLQDDEGEGDAD